MPSDAATNALVNAAAFRAIESAVEPELEQVLGIGAQGFVSSGWPPSSTGEPSAVCPRNPEFRNLSHARLKVSGRPALEPLAFLDGLVAFEDVHVAAPKMAQAASAAQLLWAAGIPGPGYFLGDCRRNSCFVTCPRPRPRHPEIA